MAYSGGSTGVNSAVLPTHSTGNLILIFAYNQDDNTIPDLPVGYISVDTQTGGNNAFRVGYKLATSASETSGTWTNATNVLVQVYSSATTSFAIGTQPTSAEDFGTLLDYPAATLDVTDGSSWVVAFAGHRANNGTIDTPPSGMVNRVFSNEASSLAVGHDTNGGVVSFAGDSVEIGGSGSSWWTSVIEIIEVASSVTIDDTTDPLNTNAQATVNGSGFEATQGSGTVTQEQGVKTTPLTVNTWSDTQLIVDSLDIESTTYFYGTHTLRVVADGGDSATVDFESIPAVNNSYVNIASLATEGDRLTAIPDLAVGDQVRYHSVLYDTGVPTAYTVTVNDDGTFSVDGSTPVGTYTFQVKAWDASDESWGLAADQTVEITSGGVNSTINITMTGIPDGSYLTRIFREDTGALVHNGMVVFSSDSASQLLSDVPVGTQTTTYVIDGETPPITYGADQGLTV